MLLNVIKRQQKSHRPSRKPITSNILYDMVKLLQQGIFFTHYSNILMSTECVVAFFGFPSSAEFTCKSSLNHAVWNNRKPTHFVKESILSYSVPKRTKSTLFPIQQLLTYLFVRNSTFACKPNDPLFVMENGNVLTRSRFLEILKQFYIVKDTQKVAIPVTQDFCMGARIKDHLIKAMDRWSSDSYLRYIWTADSTIQHAQLSMLYS